MIQQRCEASRSARSDTKRRRLSAATPRPCATAHQQFTLPCTGSPPAPKALRIPWAFPMSESAFDYPDLFPVELEFSLRSAAPKARSIALRRASRRAVRSPAGTRTLGQRDAHPVGNTGITFDQGVAVAPLGGFL